MVIVDVQRGGPSTGLPTKTEQADLLLAMYGRHGEAPLPIVAAKSPSDCFDAAFEAVRIAVKYRTPVILLTDGYLANGAEPWQLPDVEALPDISTPFATEPNHGDEFWPYLRDPETLARPWAVPGTPGLMHRVGGLEKEDGIRQRQLRAREPREDGATASSQDRRHRERHPAASTSTPTTAPSSSCARGVARGASQPPRSGGSAPAACRSRTRTSRTCIRSPPTSATSLRGYDTVLVPELNLGQLSKLLRAEYLVDAQTFYEGAGQSRSRRPKSKTRSWS